MQRPARFAAIATVAAISTVLVSSASAAVVTFNSAADLTGNFRDFTTAQTLAVTGGVLNVTSNSSSARAIAYDTTPADATQKTTFSAVTGPVTVSFDLGNVTNANSSIGVYFIDAAQAENVYASGIALLNVNAAGENDLVRVASFVQPSTASAGSLSTIFQGADLGIGLNGSMKTITATYTRIDAQNSSISMTVGSTTVTGNFNGWWAPTNVEVGLRLYPSTGGASLNLDNFTVVPEPAALGLVSLSGLMLMRRKRA